jgi:hypothetical protein
MPRQMRRICSECDKELPTKNAAPADPDVKYVNDPHRGCIEPREKAAPPLTMNVEKAVEAVKRGPGRPPKVAEPTPVPQA